MVKIGTSPAGSWRQEAGFTLLELRGGLVIIGLLAVSIPGFVIRDNKAFDLDRFTRRIAESPQSTQTTAITGNRDKFFGIDVERRQFLAANTKAPVQLPDDVRPHFVTARQEQIGQSAGQIRFFPDGSSTGGWITHYLEGLVNVIEVDWLTGLISVTGDAS